MKDRWIVVLSLLVFSLIVALGKLCTSGQIGVV
jgi:hypothetical protein